LQVLVACADGVRSQRGCIPNYWEHECEDRRIHERRRGTDARCVPKRPRRQ
jgi:hypothetical protein